MKESDKEEWWKESLVVDKGGQVRTGGKDLNISITYAPVQLYRL